MNTKTLNCKGMTCPQPLVACRRLLESEAPASLDVLVDDEAALENVTSFLTASGYAASHVRQGDGWVPIHRILRLDRLERGLDRYRARRRRGSVMAGPLLLAAIGREFLSLRGLRLLRDFFFLKLLKQRTDFL